MTWPEPTRTDHERFCQTEGWSEVRNGRGKTGSHHHTYQLHLADGRILRTRISHPVNRTGYGRSMWNHILTDQLDVTEREFWACAKDGTLPDRGAPPPPLTEPIPADLVYQLIHKVGLSDPEVAVMTRSEAIQRLQRYWTDGE